jgi:putative molybdopterin biosynthesis protein
VDLGVIAASGYTSVEVTRKPVIGIIPTGSEVVPIGDKLEPGEIIEFNSIVLAGQVSAWGGLPTRFPIIPDDLNKIQHSSD